MSVHLYKPPTGQDRPRPAEPKPQPLMPPKRFWWPYVLVGFLFGVAMVATGYVIGAALSVW